MSDGEWNVSVRFVFEFAMRIVFGFEGADREVEVKALHEGSRESERWKVKAVKKGLRQRQIVET